ncbi:uncharacterized protein LOC110306346 isoform X2 [Mus caroli]|nr:uncharacterized protein LOC110306346 isoform X2 [Mus caroli]
MGELRGAGPDPDSTLQVPSENPHQVYHNPEDPTLRTLDFRDPPRVNPDLAGNGQKAKVRRQRSVCFRCPVGAACARLRGRYSPSFIQFLFHLPGVPQQRFLDLLVIPRRLCHLRSSLGAGERLSD